MRLSASSLSVLKDCELCFWRDKVKGIPRPRGIFPSLPGGIDRVMKEYIEREIKGPGKNVVYHFVDVNNMVPYPDRAKILKWQNWRSGLSVDLPGGVTVIGALDEVAFHPEGGLVSPYDFKTKGGPPKPGDSEKYYGHQMDIYHLLLQEGAGLKCTGNAYLRYGWPKYVLDESIEFGWETVTLMTDPTRAIEFVGKAVRVMGMAEPPLSGEDCEYCKYALAMK